jgi:hypothetical protein
MTRSPVNATTTSIGPSRPSPSRVEAIKIGTVATFGHHARTVTVFTTCTSAGHPLFLDMNVYFHRRAGKLGGGAPRGDLGVELQWLGNA